MTVEEFYKRNYYFPFLGHVISHLENHVPEEQRHLLLAFHLLPNNVHELTDDDCENIKEESLKDLPSPASYDQELDRWQQRTQETRADNKRQQLTDLLGSPAVAQFYPNVHAVSPCCRCCLLGRAPANVLSALWDVWRSGWGHQWAWWGWTALHCSICT